MPISRCETVLGVRVDSASAADFLHIVENHISSAHRSNPCVIFTPNPEMLVASTKDTYFQDVLNEASINLCDGFGTVLLYKVLYPRKKKIQRVTGTDFMLSICQMAASLGKTVYFLGSGQQAVLQQTVAYFKKHVPGLAIAGSHPGISISIVEKKVYGLRRRVLEMNETAHDEMIHDIILRAPDILFVAFGHEKQEKWVIETIKHLPSVQVVMGVGGAFDFYSGTIRRAPRLLQLLGLEWFWRGILQPARFRRIFTATVLFSFLMIKERYTSTKHT